MTIPIIEVSSVAQASSFYASILQPLGIWYIETSTDAQLGTSVTFGSGGQPVLQIHQFNRRPSQLRLSAIAFEIPSKSTVGACLEVSRRANPDGPHIDQGNPDSSHATILDLDGNRLCLLSPATPVVSPTRVSGIDSARVLGWTYDIESTNQDCSYCGRHPLHEAKTSPALVTVNSETDDLKNEGSDNASLSSSTILGALLGAAAGAALTYGLMTTDSKNPGQGAKSTPNPADETRTIHDEQTQGQSSHTVKELKPTNGSAQRITFQDQTKASVPRTMPSSRSISKADSVSINHQSAKATSKDASALSMSKLSLMESKSRASKASVRSEKIEAVKRIEAPSSESRRSRTSRSQVSQSCATAPESRQDTFVSARSHPRSVVSQARISIPLETSSRLSSANRDTKSHVSVSRSRISARNIPLPLSEATFQGDARSKVSGPGLTSQISARQVQLPESEAIFRGDIKSRVSASRSRVSARNVPLPESEATFKAETRSKLSALPGPTSHTSARNVPLPSSDVGSSHANWDDDRASLAPSDSISCIGSKAMRNA